MFYDRNGSFYWGKIFERIDDNGNNGSEQNGSNNNGSTFLVLTGEYTIEEATNSSITFENGSWTYVYGSQTKTGTYTLDESRVTINYSTGEMTISATFSISGTADSITLTGESGDITSVIGVVFMATEAVSSGAITLSR